VTSLRATSSILGADGFQASLRWATPDDARTRAEVMAAEHHDQQIEIVRNPHCTNPWAARRGLLPCPHACRLGCPWP
jgi:hypothetical protein